MSIPRYAVCDDYVFEEIRREYVASDPQGRIQMLQRLYKEGGRLPWRMALLAVEDSHTEVRQRLARNGKNLDYSEPNYSPKSGATHDPDRNLEDRLKKDPDPFVRASLRENPTVFCDIGFVMNWQEDFAEATHLERLALVRNPEIGLSTLIEKLFDPEDVELGLTLEHRSELVLAYFTNEEALKKTKKGQGYHPYDAGGWYTWRTSTRCIWRSASKWPPESAIPYGVYKHVGADDGTKAAIYRTCKKPILRYVILENCDGSEDERTIKLALSDKNEYETVNPRALACAKVVRLRPSTLEILLQSKDEMSLQALARNPNLSLEQLKKVAARLNEVKEDELDWKAASDADNRVYEMEEGRKRKDPEELFDDRKQPGELSEPEWRQLLDQKINSIGKEAAIHTKGLLFSILHQAVWTRVYAVNLTHFVMLLLPFILLAVLGSGFGWVGFVMFMLIAGGLLWKLNKDLTAVENESNALARKLSGGEEGFRIPRPFVW